MHEYALVITCIDFRIPNIITNYFHNKNIKFYQCTIPGASLGIINNSNYLTLIGDIVNICFDLQDLKYVYILDHLDCKYYQRHLSLDNHFNNQDSLNNHLNILTKLKNNTDFHRLFSELQHKHNFEIIYAIISHDTIIEYI
jgi:carbonic anhydrase